MKRAVFLLAFLAAAPALAQFEAGIQHIIVVTGERGELDVPLSRGFAVTGEWFFSPRVSAQLSAAFTNPEAILYPENPPPSDVDLGTIGLQTTAVTARWHFATEGRFGWFAGAGPAFVTVGNLDDQFGDAVEADFGAETTFLAEAGGRFHFLREPRLVFSAAVSYMPLTVEPKVRKTNVALPREIALDPVTVALAVAWRF